MSLLEAGKFSKRNLRGDGGVMKQKVFAKSCLLAAIFLAAGMSFPHGALGQGPTGPQQFPVGTNPFSVALDGANIWVANYGSKTVTKLRASDGAVQGTYEVGTHPVGMAFDGANIWVANSGSKDLTKLR